MITEFYFSYKQLILYKLWNTSDHNKKIIWPWIEECSPYHKICQLLLMPQLKLNQSKSSKKRLLSNGLLQRNILRKQHYFFNMKLLNQARNIRKLNLLLDQTVKIDIICTCSYQITEFKNIKLQKCLLSLFYIISQRQMQFSPNFAQQQEEIQDVPSQFDANCPNPSNFHQTPQFSSNLTQRKNYNILTPKKTSNQQFFQKSEQYINLKKQKIGNLKAEVEQKVMADCTFKPVINRSKSKSTRNLKQFLDSQANHQAKISEKTNNLKQRIEYQNLQTMSFSPKINKKKIERNKQNVHQRLYKLKDKDIDVEIEAYDHIPKITERSQRMVRNLRIDDLLYQDARRRAEKQQHNQNLELHETPKEKNPSIQKFAAQKFLKDYKAALFSVNLQQKQEFQEPDFNSVLQTLGYSIYTADQATPLAQQQHQLMKQAFMFLSQTGVTQSNLFIFLLAIGGIYDVQIGDKISIDQEQGRKIHNYFDTLFRNRLLNDYSKRLGRTPPKQQSPFKPTINPDSSCMAEKYRCKMIQKANNIFAKNSIDIQIPDKGITHSDLLVIYNLGQNLEKEKLRQQKKYENDPECTFQPNFGKYSQDIHSQDVGAEKCNDLYEQARSRQADVNKVSNTIQTLMNQQNSRKKDVKASKMSKDSTSQSKSNIKSYLEIKDVDKTLARMAVGRQIRNEKRQYEERGEKAVHKHQTRKRISQWHNKNRELLFDVDVSINGKNKKIYVYKDDQYRIPQVVAEFSQQCFLDNESKYILEKQLLDAVSRLTKNRHIL